MKGALEMEKVVMFLIILGVVFLVLFFLFTKTEYIKNTFLKLFEVGIK